MWQPQSTAIPNQDLEKQRRYRKKLKANPAIAICCHCGATYSTADTNGRKWRCRPCLNEYQREVRRRMPKAQKAEYSRRYRDRLGDAYREYSVNRRREKIAMMSEEELKAFRSAEAEKTKRLNAVTKDAVFEAYGGWKCACCGETEKSFLSIDHVENNGSQLRRAGIHGKPSAEFYRWLKRRRFPKGFQVLCMNCNVGKHRNGGVCPHQVRRND